MEQMRSLGPQEAQRRAVREAVVTPRLLSTAEVAALLRVTPGAVATAVRRGRGPVPYGRGGRGRADGARKLGGFNDLRNSLPNALACFRHMPILKTMTTTETACTCGNTCDHVVCKRTTADGIHVQMHSDGAVVGRMGFKIEGVPVARPRSREAVSVALRAGWLFMGEVEAYDYEELGTLYAACRWVAERDGMPGSVRVRLHYVGRMRPVWTVVSCDRDGRPTCRYWRLPRAIAGHFVVWDHVSVGASGGRYEIGSVTPGDDVFQTTGIRFNRLDDVWAHIKSEAA